MDNRNHLRIAAHAGDMGQDVTKKISGAALLTKRK
jgi:hypothetical protein